MGKWNTQSAAIRLETYQIQMQNRHKPNKNRGIKMEENENLIIKLEKISKTS